MILGIGIDVVEIDRFNKWRNYPQKNLNKILSKIELDQLDKEHSSYFEQFLASRFAAKEAFFKALSDILVKLNLTKQKFSFQFARTEIAVIKSEWDTPTLQVNWKAFEEKIGTNLPKLNVNLSISHEKSIAIALVVLYSSL